MGSWRRSGSSSVPPRRSSRAAESGRSSKVSTARSKPSAAPCGFWRSRVFRGFLGVWDFWMIFIEFSLLFFIRYFGFQGEQWFSEALGKATIDTKTHGQTKGKSGSYSTNFQMSGRELLTPDEVRGLDNRAANSSSTKWTWQGKAPWWIWSAL